MIEVTRAPGYLTVQDLGRIGYRNAGVPRSGVMDRVAATTLNCMIGNDRNDAVLETALGRAELRFDVQSVFACGGVSPRLELNGKTLVSYCVYEANAGDAIAIEPHNDGRFGYFAVLGGIDCEPLLGSRSTYLPGGWGGMDGRRLIGGDRLNIREHRARTLSASSETRRMLPESLQPANKERPLRFIPAVDPSDESLKSLVNETFRVSPASDRTGFRLDGASIPGGASITSEPVFPGVIQLPPGGQPIVLMADAPTIGGYKILGCVISADLSLFAQKLPGNAVSLEIVTVEEAERARSQNEDAIGAVEQWFRSRVREVS